LDKFPEAYKRYEDAIDTSEMKTFQELLYSFRGWGKQRFPPTTKQIDALKIEAKKHLDLINKEFVSVRGSRQVRYRNLKSGRFAKNPEG